jgi:DNA-binding MarR family transcriptional regulator
MKRTTKTRTKPPTEIPEFDSEGVHRSLLAALRCLYQAHPHITLPQYLIALEVLSAERGGNPHTLASLVRTLEMPFSTASRVVWSLTAEGGEIGVIKYKNHPTDRRKKYLVTEGSGLSPQIARAIRRAMAEYYGDSVRKLKPAPAGR